MDIEFDLRFPDVGFVDNFLTCHTEPKIQFNPHFLNVRFLDDFFTTKTGKKQYNPCFVDNFDSKASGVLN